MIIEIETYRKTNPVNNPIPEKTFDDEIDLLSLLETIWDGKWTIVSIMVVFLLSVFGFNIVIPNTTFIART